MRRFTKAANIILRHCAVRMGADAMYYSGGLALLRAGFHGVNGHVGWCPFAILLYHRVNPDSDPFFPAVSVNVFEAQMRYLATNFRVRSLSEILRRLRQGKGIEPLTIAITFDDGYRDNYSFAYPILKKYHLPATVFVATGFIGTEALMWNDRVAWAVKNAQQEKIVCQFGRRECSFPLHTDEDRLNSLNSILEELKLLPEIEKRQILQSIIDELASGKPEPTNVMLDWSSLREMANEGWDVGSHTVSHQILTRVEASRATEELKNSKETIEDKLQRAVTICAFPNGKRTDFDSSIKAMVQELGYYGAATTLSGINGFHSDLYELHRWSVWEKHLPTLACKLNYSYRRQENENNS